jgi:hypothetical protein
MADAPSNASLTGGEPSPRRFSFLLKPWMFTVGVLAASGVILRAEGRRWWCACGDWSPWAGNVWSSHCSQHLVDPYAFTHVSHGLWLWFIVGWIRPALSDAWRLRLVVMFEACWEILENSPMVIDRYRTATISLDYVGDSVFNSLGDIAACLLGALAARRLGLVRSLVIFIALEIALAFAIRDTLSLNVLMLLRPVEAVKQWQMSGH